MVIVGIDPGLNTTGYGAISTDEDGRPSLREGGTIRPARNLPLELRLCEIHRGVRQILEELQPHIVVVEELFSRYEHPKTAILMGHARGAVYLAAGQLGFPVVGYAASTVKRSLTGSGRASKSQVQQMVQDALSLAEAPEPDDVSDALALALCHANTERPILAGYVQR